MTPRFSADLPMFLDDAHRALDEAHVGALEGLDLFDHDAPRALGALRASRVFELLVPAACAGRALAGTPEVAVSVRALSVTREALAYRSPLADSIFAVQGLGSHPIVLTPEFPGRSTILREVVSGARICAFALTEPEAGSDVASMRTVARRDGAGWILDGEKAFISNVGIADHYVVFANADPSLGKKGISAFLVDREAPGLSLEPVLMSSPHPLGRLRMNACRAQAMIGEVGRGLRLALGTLDVFRTSVGAAACGMARRALDSTLARVKARVQFGKSLAEQPIVQEKLAIMATELDAARLLVYRAAWCKDRGQAAATEVAMAKLYATEAAQRIIDQAVQLHGGLGVVLGTDVEQLYREIRPLRIYEGTTEIQTLIIGGALVK